MSESTNHKDTCSHYTRIMKPNATHETHRTGNIICLSEWNIMVLVYMLSRGKDGVFWTAALARIETKLVSIESFMLKQEKVEERIRKLEIGYTRVNTLT